MFKTENQVNIKAPVKKIWNWAKAIENVISITPFIKMKEKKSKGEAIIGIKLSEISERFTPLPKDFMPAIEGSAKMVEMDESKWSIRTKAEFKFMPAMKAESVPFLKIFEGQTFLKLEPISGAKTSISFKVEGEEMGIAEAVLSGFGGLNQERLDEIAKEVGNKLKQIFK